MRQVWMRKYLAWGVLALAFMLGLNSALATNVFFDLTEVPGFNASPATNRQITLQATTPFPGNVVFLPPTDATGRTTNFNMGTGLWNGVIKAPPGQIQFQLYVTSTNLGLIDALSIPASGQSSTYPAGSVAWSIFASDQRYQLSTNGGASNLVLLPWLISSNFVQNPTLNNSSNFLFNYATTNPPNLSIASGTLNIASIVVSAPGALSGFGDGLYTTNPLALTPSTNSFLSSNNVAAMLAANTGNFATISYVNTATNQVQSNLVATNTALISVIVSSNLAAGVLATNYTLQIGANDTNFARGVIGLANTNLSYALAANGSNNVITASNNLLTTLIASNTANLIITTNLVSAVVNSTALTNNYVGIVNLQSNLNVGGLVVTNNVNAAGFTDGSGDTLTNGVLTAGSLSLSAAKLTTLASPSHFYFLSTWSQALRFFSDGTMGLNDGSGNGLLFDGSGNVSEYTNFTLTHGTAFGNGGGLSNINYLTLTNKAVGFANNTNDAIARVLAQGAADTNYATSTTNGFGSTVPVSMTNAANQFTGVIYWPFTVSGLPQTFMTENGNLYYANGFALENTNGNLNYGNGNSLSDSKGNIYYGNGQLLGTNGLLYGNALNVTNVQSTNIVGQIPLSIANTITTNSGAISTNFALTIGANDTNFARGVIGLAATNLTIAATNGFTQIVYTNANQIVMQMGQATNLNLQGSFAMGTKTNWLYSTNCIGIGSCGSPFVTGTYFGSGGNWTNPFYTFQTIVYSAPNYFIKSNAVTLYASTDAINWTTVGGVGTAPAPLGAFGHLDYDNGSVYLGWFYSTNIASQIQNVSNQIVANINGYGTGTLLTNSTLTTALSIGVTNLNILGIQAGSGNISFPNGDTIQETAGDVNVGTWTGFSMGYSNGAPLWETNDAIIGGAWNDVAATTGNRASYTSIFGGFTNIITAPVRGSIIAGGMNNSIAASGNFDSIFGGFNNSISGTNDTILGGQYNSLSGGFSFIGSGNSNSITGSYNYIGSGVKNVISGNGGYDFIGGGFNNLMQNFSTNCAIISGQNNSISLANNVNIIGSNVGVSESGVTVISDGLNNLSFSTSSETNTLFIQFTNGVAINTNSTSIGTFALNISGVINASAGLSMPTNYVAAHFTPIVGQVTLCPSNNHVYAVSQTYTNLAW